MAKLDELVGQLSGGQPDRIAALAPPSGGGGGGGTPPPANQEATTDLLNQLFATQQKIEKMGEQKPQGVTDQLTSLPGILSLLAAGGSAAFGGQAGMEGGAALINSLVGGMQGNKAGEQAQINADRGEMMGLLEAQRQRLSTMLTNRPEMFIDSATGEPLVDPRVLMVAATGMSIPVNPAVNYNLTKQTQATKIAVDMGMNLALNGDTPQKVEQGVMIVDNALNLNLSPEFYTALMGQDERGQIDSLLRNPGLDTGSILSMWQYIRATPGKSLRDADVIGMITPSINTDAAGGKLTIPDRVLQLTQEYSKVLAAAGPATQNLSFEETIDFVWGGDRAGDAALFKNHFMGKDAFNSGLHGKQILDMMIANGQADIMLYSMYPDMPYFKQKGITSADDLWKLQSDSVSSGVRHMQNAATDLFAQNRGNALRNIGEKIYQLNPDLDFAAVMVESNTVLLDLVKQATVNGRVDAETFNTLVTKFIGDTNAPAAN